ncbi:septation ring formation regulator EzrA [Candidatus Gracilibacteria bacterium]|nr:septation ring formation regulator EzrA [Candidatus Gracilibacteria bacterium]
MITKIISGIILLGVSYGLTVFFAPQVSTRIDAFIGLPGLTEKLKGSKEKLDFVSTDGVNSALDSANQMRNNAREIVDTTKDRIDTVREQGQRIEEGYKELQENIDTLKEVYESTSQAIEQVGEGLQNIRSSTGSTEAE